MNISRYAPFILPAVVLLLLIGLFARGLFLDPTKVRSPLVVNPIPKFSLPDLHDPSKRLDQRMFLGQVVLFNAWASWCGPCHEEHPVLMEFAKQKLLPIYGMDYKDQRQDALAMLDKDGNPYQSVLSDSNGDVAIDWGVYGAPETFLIDKHGMIRDKIIGALTPDILNHQLIPEIRKLQAEVP